MAASQAPRVLVSEGRPAVGRAGRQAESGMRKKNLEFLLTGAHRLLYALAPHLRFGRAGGVCAGAFGRHSLEVSADLSGLLERKGSSFAPVAAGLRHAVRVDERRVSGSVL